MREQHLLDLAGEDAETGGDDHVALAVDDRDESVRAHHRDIAGEQPVVVQHRRAVLALVPVATEDLRAANHHLPSDTVRLRPRGIVLRADPHLGAGQRDAG
jgi:hypothetical protein